MGSNLDRLGPPTIHLNTLEKKFGFATKNTDRLKSHISLTMKMQCTGVIQVIRIVTANPNFKQPLPAKSAHLTA